MENNKSDHRSRENSDEKDELIHRLKIRNEELEKQHADLSLELEKNNENIEVFKDIFETVREGIAYTTLSGKVLSINKYLEQILELPKENIEGKNIIALASALLTANNIRLAIPLLKSLIAGKEINPFQIEYKNKILEITATINRKTKRLTGQVSDITEKVQIERALKKSEARLRRAELASKSGNWELHLDSKVMIGSDGAVKLYGLDRNSLDYKIAKDVALKEYRPMMDEAMEKLLKYNEPYNIEFKLRNATTGEIIDIHSVCEYDSENRILFGSIQDITDFKKAEEEIRKKNIDLTIAKDKAEESDKLKTAFLHNISHEIRTPLNAIIGFSGFLDQPDLTPENRKEYIDIIFQSNNQLLSIINDILNISHIETGQVQIRESQADLNLILNNLYNQFRAEAEMKNLDFRLNTDFAGTDSIVVTDDGKLIQVITNLLNNAFKFTKEGHIELGCRVKGKIIEFYIEDTGIGIPEEVHEKIFERFYQVDQSVTRVYTGTGLGLSISSAYVEFLGGKLSVRSSPGNGSVFEFSIPYKHPATLRSEENVISPSEKPVSSGIKTLLIAEDEESNYALIRAMLKSYNYIILRALNGLEAVDICRNNPDIDLILMDLKMPVKDGFEATAEILKFRPSMPIIAQTAYAHTSDKTKALECGCIDYLSKPFQKKQLVSLLEKYFN
jgi:PAS domain S-box-containing protein